MRQNDIKYMGLDSFLSSMYHIPTKYGVRSKVTMYLIIIAYTNPL